MISSRSVQQIRVGVSLLKESRSLSGSCNRIRRFLKEQDIDPQKTACTIRSLLPEGQVVLALDRTHWERGGEVHNYLVLSIVLENNAVPLFAHSLGKEGNSNTEERIAIMKEYLSCFGVDSIKALTADREFIGEEWIHWLQSQRIPFAIRIKGNTLAKHPNGGTMQVKRWFGNETVPKTVQTIIWNTPLTLTACTLQGGEFLAIISNMQGDKGFQIYRLRWGIECGFKALKSEGFDIENTHLSPERFEKLFRIIALAFAGCVAVGLFLQTIKPLPFRKSLNTKLFSIFKTGLYDFIAKIKLDNPFNRLFIHAKSDG